MEHRPVDLAALRAEYADGGLDVGDLAADPSRCSSAGSARRSPPDCTSPTRWCSARPAPRTARRRGWCCSRAWTSAASCSSPTTASRKGEELAADPRCALLFPWHPLERQVRIEGTAPRARARGCRGLLPPPGRAARSSAPGPARSHGPSPRATSSRRRTTRWRRGSRDRTCRARPLGWLSGRAGDGGVLAGPAGADARPAGLPCATARAWRVDRAAGVTENHL